MKKVVVLMCVLAAALAPSTAPAYPPPIIIQYFEAKWDVVRYRMPDVFMAGYDSVWTPPIQKGQGGTSSIGYDLFDRLDFGTGTGSSQTRYGNENTLRLMIEEFHKAGCRVFVDYIMNHNGTWDNTTTGFIAQGGYPGFVLQNQSDPYGDFHTPGTQSENPGGANYNLYEGRLLGLIDIAQEKNWQYIRHPATAGDPNNIPAGSVWNKVDPNNRKFYPDTALTPYSPVNPGTNRNPSPPQFTFYPFNPSDPSAGDPVLESAASLLLRSTQYYLEILKIDGFRLDAAKHVPTWFWDNQWDAIVYNRYKAFDGTTQIPYSFVEAVGGGGINPPDWVRKPGEPGSGTGYPSIGWQFGNRDALDLDEAGQLRDLVNNDGSGSWDSGLGASIDNVDGYNNGTIGVHHVNSHDNAVADGENDSAAQAYVMMRTGPACVYYMAFQFGNPPNGFPRRNGRDDALGLGSSVITTLVKLRNEFGRGWFIPLTTGGQQQDVLIFSRRTPNSTENVLIGVNDREDNGYDSRTITTTYPQGTRLWEQTGNAANPTVDPNNNISEMLTVGAGGSLAVRVPRNRNANGVFHGLGYVIYGQALPSGTLSITNATTTIVPPDPAGNPDYKQRVSPIIMVTSSTLDIQLQTTQTDAGDPDTDDLAVFRIDQGFKDYNGNGSTYLGLPSSDFNAGNTSAESPSYGFENFLTQNEPRCQAVGGNCTNAGAGLYRQTLSAAALGEGYHYITVRAYRHRPAGLDPLFAEFRTVIYVDLADPDYTLVSPTATCNNDIPSVPVDFIVKSDDLTPDSIYMFVDLPAATDFIALATGPTNLATQLLDTFTLRRSGLITGNHRLDVVAIETLPTGVKRYLHRTYTGIQSFTGTAIGPGDIDANGTRDGLDIYPFVQYLTGVNPTFGPAADMDCDGLINENDIPLFVSQLLAP